LISNCYRDFGSRRGTKPDNMYVIGIMFGVINGGSRFLWGWLMDIFGFKILMLFITILEIIIASTFYFCAKNAALYIISVLLVSACIGGHFAILSPVFNKIFGLERGPEMYGVTGNFIGIASICGPIFTNFILNDTPDFLVVFLVGGGLCIIKLIILIFFDENDAYKYENVDSLLGEDKNQDNRIEKDNEDEIPTTNNDEGEGITDN
jgi:MFS family permease